MEKCFFADNEILGAEKVPVPFSPQITETYQSILN